MRRDQKQLLFKMKDEETQMTNEKTKPEFTLEFADMGPYDEINRLNRLNTSLQDTVNTLVRILDVFTKVKQFNWIPMSEKQPTVRGHYLVTAYRAGDKSYEIETDYWDGLGEFWECWGEKVLAWAELPEPYTGDNDDHQ